jgi:maleate isomerase
VTAVGVVIPSSNTVVEQVLPQLLGERAGVTLHVARFPLERLGADAPSTFPVDAVFAAAELLSHAHVATIAYCGVSGAWLGIDRDEAFCARVARELRTPACTATLAVVAALRAAGVERLGLVKAGPPALAERVDATFAALDLHCTRVVGVPVAAHADLARIEAAARAVAGNGAEAVCIMGTNLLGAPLVERLEAELGVPLLDSVVATAWRLCSTLGIVPSGPGWGSLTSIRAAA